MAKPFKLRMSKVITSLQSCNSKDTSTLPEDPVPSFLRQSSSPTKLITAVDFPVTNTHRSSSALRRHVSSALISVGCGLTSRNSSARSRPPPEFKWREEENWHVVANICDETKPRRKIYSSSVSGDDKNEVLALPPPPPPPSTAERKKRRARKKKTTAVAVRISTSSADESGLFSNDEEETETLVSSLSTDSSFEFNPKTDHNNRIIRRSKRKPKKRAAKRGTAPTARRASVSSTTSSEGEVPARLSVFKKLIPCSVEGKVKESFAVVKKSRDPHEDFKRSMMEMILEKQMFEKDDLEELLQCFLSLNARQYHGIIVGAFSEIWAELFFAANNVSSSPRMSTAFGPRTPSCS
nr:transcription repressor OFP7-like isoform X1 [Ipomoea trifida]